MDDLLKKFSAAAKIISTNKNPMRESVYGAFVDHLSDINPKDLPEDVQIIYESVEMRLNSTVPPGAVGDEEAGYLAKDILYIADVLKAQYHQLKSELHPLFIPNIPSFHHSDIPFGVPHPHQIRI